MYVKLLVIFSWDKSYVKKVYPIKCFNFKIVSHKGPVFLFRYVKGNTIPFFDSYSMNTHKMFLKNHLSIPFDVSSHNFIVYEYQPNTDRKPIKYFDTPNYWISYLLGLMIYGIFSCYWSNLNCLFDRPVISWYLMCCQFTLSRHANLTNFWRKCAFSYFSS